MNIDFNRRLSIAPMLDCTDRHERYFLRLISKHVLLYSEMVVTHALLHANPEMFLGHEEFEYPAALQLGGSNPTDLAKCSKMVEAAGFQEVNLNCGCPSDRVQSGSFGAVLMKDKNLVADCFKAMQDAVSIPVSIKCRIGVDEFDSWEFFRDFIQTIADAGCKYFIIHARKAWLKGLSPKENREVPPLHYEFVHRLKAEMPQLNLSINGGIRSMDVVEEQLKDLDGVMVGREPYENPWFLHDADERIFKDERRETRDERDENHPRPDFNCHPRPDFNCHPRPDFNCHPRPDFNCHPRPDFNCHPRPDFNCHPRPDFNCHPRPDFNCHPRPDRGSSITPLTRKAVLKAYLPYVEKQFAAGCPATILVKHLYGLFTGLPGARKFRQVLSESAPRARELGGPAELIRRAMEFVTEE